MHAASIINLEVANFGFVCTSSYAAATAHNSLGLRCTSFTVDGSVGYFSFAEDPPKAPPDEVDPSVMRLSVQ